MIPTFSNHHYQNQLSMDKLYGICDWAMKKANKIIVRSANRPNPSNLRRSILLALVRKEHTETHILAASMNLNPTHGNATGNISAKGIVNPKSKRVMTIQEFEDELWQGPGHWEDKTHHKNGKPVTNLHERENIARHCVELGIGNCDEKSNMSLMLLLEYPRYGLGGLPTLPNRHIRIEVIYLDDPEDHVFLVVNRPKQSKLRKLNTWYNPKTNHGAIIVDPWANRTLDVAQQFTLAKQNREKIFNRICHGERYIYRDYESYIGAGHSSYWQSKRSMLFRELDDYAHNGKENLCNAIQSPAHVFSPRLK